jgi:REP element-mobilizing transposase RayT
LFEIGTDHVHFLVQPIPTYRVTKLVMMKSLTIWEIPRRCPHVKKQLSDRALWTDGHLSSTIRKHGDDVMIGKYVKNRVKNISSHTAIII